MKVERYPSGVVRDDTSVVTVGTFDGVHLGHRFILQELLRHASASEGTSTVVTFDPHPREVVTGEIVPMLNTVHERVQLLREEGVDRVVIVPFDYEFAHLPAEDYVRDVLHKSIGLREIVIGHDHGFGKGRVGDRALLDQLAGELDFGVTELSVQTNDDAVISSSRIRNLLLLQGDVNAAALLLGRPYSLEGRVVRGDGRGQSIGFPTANLALGDSRKILPLRGVYAVTVVIDGDEEVHRGMMNIGFRPTFDGSGLRVEVHIIDIDRNLYDERLQVEFVKRIRNERKFGGIEELREQLWEDKERCIRALKEVV